MNWYVCVKHDNCDDQKGGHTGKNLMSVGPYSRKAAKAEANTLRLAHRTLHSYDSPYVICLIRVEREPLDV